PHHPVVSAGGRFIELVAQTLAGLAAIEYQAAGAAGIEPDLLNGAGAALAEEGLPPPGLAAIGSDQQERIARQRIDDLAGDPAVLETGEEDPVEAGPANTLEGLAPGLASIARRQHDGVEGARGGMDVSHRKNLIAYRLERGRF